MPKIPSRPPSQPPIEYLVPEELKQYGITRIVQVGPFIKTLYNGVSISANFDIAKLKTSMNEFREEAGKIITTNGIDASEIIEKVASHIVSEATSRYERDLAEGKLTVGNGEAESKQSEEDEDSEGFQSLVTAMKYTVNNKRTGLSQLWETVKIGGKYYFVSYDLAQNSVLHVDKLEDNAASKTVYPFAEDGAVEHYSYANFEELQQTIQNAKMYTASSLFKKVKTWAGKFYDTDTQEYINLIAADVVFTYFQDRIGTTHYIFVFGDPDQGKGVILEIFNQLAYRGALISSVTPAAIYRMLGSVEKGQITMIIDEANRLENDDFILTILKVGYKGNAKIPRSVDSQHANHKMEYFHAYCFKIIAAEKLPIQWKTGGFLSRNFKIKTAPGSPEIDIGDVINNAGDPKNSKILQELVDLRKLLFAYRLLHYSEPIPDLNIKGIRGRDKELTKPLLRLFNTHGGYDSETFDVIKNTLYCFVKERNKDKTDSLNAKVLELVKKRINDYNQGKPELTFSEVWDYIVKEQLSGKPIDDKPNSMRTSLFGDISKDRVAAIMRGLGGNRDRNSAGDKRIWKFDMKTLDRFSNIYKQIPDTVEIEEPEQQTTLGFAMASVDDISPSDTSDRFGKVDGGSDEK